MDVLSLASVVLTFLATAHIEPKPVFGAAVIDGIPAGHWYAIPDSRLDQQRDVFPPVPTPQGNPRNVLAAWSGAAYDSKRERILFQGGGHGDYAGNEVYAFDLNTLRWSRIWGPSEMIPSKEASEGRAAYPDGNPAAVHSYDGLNYLPDLDKLWRGGGSLWSGSGGGTRASWFLDLSTLRWQRLADSQVLGVSVASEYDPVTGHVFAFSDRQTLGEYNPRTNTWTNRGEIFHGEEQVAAIDPGRRLFVRVGNGDLSHFNINTGRITLAERTRGPQNVVTARGPGFVFDTVIRKFVGWAGGTSVYVLDPAKWNWAEVAAAATNTVAPPTIFGADVGKILVMSKFLYVPAKNIYVLVQTVDTNVYVYKLPTGDRAPAVDPARGR